MLRMQTGLLGYSRTEKLGVKTLRRSSGAGKKQKIEAPNLRVLEVELDLKLSTRISLPCTRTHPVPKP